MLNIINQQLTNGWLLTWLVVIVLSGIGWCLFDLFRGSGLKLSHKKAVGTVQETGDSTAGDIFTAGRFIRLALAVTVVGYFLLVVAVAPYQTDRYYFSIYPFIGLLLIWLTYDLTGHYCQQGWARIGILSLIVIPMVVLSYQRQSVNYLYKKHAERRALLQPYHNYPVVIINYTFHSLPEGFLMEYVDHPLTFYGRLRSLSGLRKAVDEQDITGGFLVYVFACSWSDAVNLHDELSPYLGIKRCELIVKDCCNEVYFCTMK